MNHDESNERGTKFSTSTGTGTEDGDPCDLTEISATFCFVLFCFKCFLKFLQVRGACDNSWKFANFKIYVSTKFST